MSSAGDSPAHADPSPLLTRREAAALCRVSLRTFERFVQPNLPAVAIGTRVFFAADDVKRWLDARRSSSSTGTTPATFTTRRTRSPDSPALSRQESEILAQLRARRTEAQGGAQPKRPGS